MRPHVSAANFAHCRLHRANFAYIASPSASSAFEAPCLAPEGDRAISANVDAAQALAFRLAAADRESHSTPAHPPTQLFAVGQLCVLEPLGIRTPRRSITLSPLALSLVRWRGAVTTMLTTMPQYRCCQERLDLADPLFATPPSTKGALSFFLSFSRPSALAGIPAYGGREDSAPRRASRPRYDWPCR